LKTKWKGRVKDTNGMLERKEKKHGEGERNGYSSEEVERMRAKGTRMNVEVSDRDTSKNEGKNQRI
jgi:hypothetical protein